MEMMNSYEETALRRMKEAHYKITPSRRVIVEFLSKNAKALSPYQIQITLKKRRIHADAVTIYRILAMLEGLNLVHKVLGFNGYIRCVTKENDSKDTCHHYLLCEKCKTVTEVEGEDLSKLEQKIEKQNGFSIQSHYLEFSGICRKCR